MKNLAKTSEHELKKLKKKIAKAYEDLEDWGGFECACGEYDFSDHKTGLCPICRFKRLLKE